MRSIIVRLLGVASIALLLSARVHAQTSPASPAYIPGWNLAALPSGTSLTGTHTAFTLQPGDAAYETVDPAQGSVNGYGYWVYFSGAASVRLGAGSPSPYTINAPGGQYIMIGDPSGVAPATVAGADLVYTYDPASGYQATTTLQPGQGAWALSLAGAPITVTPANPTAIGGAPPLQNAIMYVAGSTKKICQVTGETDRQFNTPTASQTGARFGLFGADVGYSFEQDGKLFFLFGDAMPTPTFHGLPNGSDDPLRSPDANDAIGFTADTGAAHCPTLDFITDANGAFRSPVVLNAQGQPAITLRIDESPDSGISVGSKMYVLFRTDNYLYPSPGPTTGNLGAATRSVMAVSDDDASSFHDLYDFSAGPDAKFIFTSIAEGDSGYLYFWGTEGGLNYRQGAPYFARKQASLIDQPGGMEYFAGLAADGTPTFSASESDAVPLFQDYDGNSHKPQNCMANHSVNWNPFVQRWIMLYGCGDRTPTNLSGIYMRFAQDPWGPWSAPQTIFNGERDAGICQFIHRAVTPTQPACDSLSPPDRLDEAGGPYAPNFIPGFTTGNAACDSSTLYYTMATFNPYTQVIMQTTIQGPAPAQGMGRGQSAACAPGT